MLVWFIALDYWSVVWLPEVFHATFQTERRITWNIIIIVPARDRTVNRTAEEDR